MWRRPLLIAAAALLIATACGEQGGTRFAESAGEPTGGPTEQALPPAEDARVADWEPDGEVDRAATRIPVHVMERDCASGEPATGRITEPDVEYHEDAVVVTFRVIPKGGPQDCPSNPATPYVLELSEPIGDRHLLDGGAEPPGPPVIDQ